MSVTLINRRLLHFMAVYESGNIKHAAELFGISQPALSMSIRQLEEELDTELFLRQPRGVIPTKAGEVLYHYSDAMKHGQRLALEDITRLKSGTPGRLRLGVGIAWTATVLDSVLPELQRQFPGMSIDLITGIGGELATQFIAGDIDVLLAAGSIPTLNQEGIDTNFIGSLPLVAVADQEHILVESDSVSATELTKFSWAGFNDDNSFFYLAQNYMSLRGLSIPEISMRSNSAAALISMVHSSELISFLVPPLVKLAAQSGLVQLKLAEPLWDIPINVYYRQISADQPLVRTFKSIVGSVIKMSS